MSKPVSFDLFSLIMFSANSVLALFVLTILYSRAIINTDAVYFVSGTSISLLSLLTLLICVCVTLKSAISLKGIHVSNTWSVIINIVMSLLLLVLTFMVLWFQKSLFVDLVT